ncbi:hypothetical protein [Mycobacterium sp.]|uniref:hypothetical protein n=1 Tax=Mycobacterium sp. TaxID=1785 RepID=UPI003341EE5E
MSVVNGATAAVAAPLLMPWMPGPVDPGDAPVVVSVTEFAAHHRRELPGVAVKGVRMRMGWYAMAGAVGMWLWMMPAARCGGSISVWETEEDLERFITLPHHVDIMRRYGDRGTVRSTTWAVDRFDRAAILDRARTWIASA